MLVLVFLMDEDKGIYKEKNKALHMQDNMNKMKLFNWNLKKVIWQ